MKVALFTIWHVKNYGAELQAYATMKILKELGVDAEIVDYRLLESSTLSLKHLILQLITFFAPENKKFSIFWKKIGNKTIHYKTLQQVYSNPPKADIYLVGSDQVWNQSITKEKAPFFFLDFGDESIIRCSYASSIGSERWIASDEITQLANKQLKKFRKISCRERLGAEALKNTFNVNVETVIDPTLLLNDYSELTGKISRKNTLVYYPLSTFSELNDFVNDLSVKLNKEIVNINYKTFLLKKIIWNRPSVESWVKSIAESSLVITPSFHGLVFSLIYNKQFIIVMNPDGMANLSRIKDLLSVLGLSERLFYSVSELKKSKIWEKMIDYNVVNRIIYHLREKSMNYFKSLFE